MNKVGVASVTDYVSSSQQGQSLIIAECKAGLTNYCLAAYSNSRNQDYIRYMFKERNSETKAGYCDVIDRVLIEVVGAIRRGTANDSRHVNSKGGLVLLWNVCLQTTRHRKWYTGLNSGRRYNLSSL
jgi:hypothetical protein